MKKKKQKQNDSSDQIRRQQKERHERQTYSVGQKLVRSDLMISQFQKG